MKPTTQVKPKIARKTKARSSRETENQHGKHFAEQYRFGFAPKSRGGRPKGTRQTLWLWLEKSTIEAINRDALKRGVKIGDWVEGAALYVLGMDEVVKLDKALAGAK